MRHDDNGPALDQTRRPTLPNGIMSGSKPPVFTPDALRGALTELGKLACDAGRIIDVAIYGGSCLMLVSNFRIATAMWTPWRRPTRTSSTAPRRRS